MSRKIHNAKQAQEIEIEAIYSSEAWLLVGFYHSLPGVLALKNGKLTFTATSSGTFGNKGLLKIEQKSGVKDFALSLTRNQPTKLFSVELSGIQKVNYPWIYFSAGANITLNDQKYRLSFIQPNNTVMPVLSKSDYSFVYGRTVDIVQDISGARKVGKKWKSLWLK